MPFTEYKFDPTEIKALVIERKTALEANKGVTNLLRFGLGVVADRLKKDGMRYKDYGPWWWSVKELMNEAGYDLGQQSDPLVAAAYRMETPEETLIAADEFRTQYLATQFIGTNQFALDPETGDLWTLFDVDMEGVPLNGLHTFGKLVAH